MRHPGFLRSLARLAWRPGRLRLAAAGVGLALVSPPAAAQVRVLDEGSFTILRGTARAGREDFSIRTSADAAGGMISAKATVAIGDRRVLPTLSTQADGGVASYGSEVRDRTTVTDQWALRVSGARADVRHRTPSADGSSDFPAVGAPVLLDDEVAHHLWFVLRRAGDGAVAAVVPVVRLRDGAVRAASVSPATDDARTIGGTVLAARRREVRLPDGTTWAAWTDASGRLLEVLMPGVGLRFLRDDPPPR